MGKNILLIAKPLPDEYPAYAAMYINRLPDDGMVLTHLKRQAEQTEKLLSGLTGQQPDYRYAPGKWTIKEIMVHVIDHERIFCYRALRIGRGDTTPLPGIEQDDYVPYSRAQERSMHAIIKEYKSVRKASRTLFSSFTPDDLLRKGTANGNPVSTRALLYLVAGHELHHCHVIREKYLQQKT